EVSEVSEVSENKTKNTNTEPKESGMNKLEERDMQETKSNETEIEEIKFNIKKPTKKKKGIFAKLSEIGTISSKEVVEFTRHLSVMISAGVTIFEAITFLRDQSRNKVFASRLDNVIESLNNGQSLSASMKKFPKVFPEIYTNIVHVGEQSGSLAETMSDLANHLEENDKFKSKVKGALLYPKIILSVMVLFLFVLFFFVMPRILTIFYSLNAEIPLATKITIGITEFIEGNILMIGLVIAGVIIGGHFILKNPIIKGHKDMLFLKFPFVGHIVLNYNTTQVGQHFGTLFASGLTIIRCLEITESVINNTVFRDEVNYMVDKIKNGSSFSNSFKEKSIFPPMFIKLIKVGERTGKLPHVIDYLKGYYKNLVDEDVKNITTIIEPVIMVLLGLMVAGLVVTVIGPIYQLISNVSN
ncbi:type II secretion system F family protein, partial [Patescibacteria group bacterium]|nr:type II secretion system F family protein [Patescibacteria group bacterium]